MANIGDVAKHLGISRSTVSYALSGKRPVSVEMKSRIEEAIKELGYWPSAAGRALATAKSNTLALLAPMAENATPAVALQFVNGVAQAARAYGYDILLVTGQEAFDGVERLVRSNQVDGLVVLDVEEQDARVAALTKSTLPSVLVGIPKEEVSLDRVDLDWVSAGHRLVAHLAELGHRTVCILGAPREALEMGMTYAYRFRNGAAAAAAEAGVRLVEVEVSNDYTVTLEVIGAVLREQPEITGFVVQHETAAGPLAAVLRSLKVRVPEDVSVVGLTLDTLDASCVAPISGIENPSTAITQAAVRMLLERIDGARPTPRTMKIPVRFTDRGTAGPSRP